jgi:kynurenine formamidase
MNYIFLSHILDSSTPSYGDRDSVEIIPQNQISQGATANTSTWKFSNNHIGTHIDLPYHFDENGKKTQDYSAKDFIFTKVALIDILCEDGILINDEIVSFDNLPEEVEIILIRTGFEHYRDIDKYWNNSPGISPSLLKRIKEKLPNLRCVGFDFISLSSMKFKQEGKDAHKELLVKTDEREPILIIEDMSLKDVSGEIKLLVVAPIRVFDGNGGPVTVIAQQD